jgi:TM2 domain-containing membrane protein YozV
MTSSKSRSVAFLLSTFLGIFGAHRFYVGKGGSGATMLILSITVFGMVITGLWNLLDWILIIGGSFRDAEGKLVNKW